MGCGASKTPADAPPALLLQSDPAAAAIGKLHTTNSVRRGSAISISVSDTQNSAKHESHVTVPDRKQQQQQQQKHSARRESHISILDRKHSRRESFISVADRKHSLLLVPDGGGQSGGAPRRLSLSIPDAGKGGDDTISIKTTNIQVEPEENGVKPMTKEARYTILTGSEPSLSESSMRSASVEETKFDENGTAQMEKGTPSAEKRTEKQTTEEESVTGKDGDDGTGKEQRLLLDFDFLQAKIQSVGISGLLKELADARQADPQDRDLEQLGLTLQLAQDALKYDPGQLPAQLLTRLTQPSPGLVPLLEQCRSADLPLLPNQPLVVPAGGQLMHTICEDTTDIKCMTMTSDGQYAITCSGDGVMMIINVVQGLPERKILQIGKDLQNVCVCCNDTVVVTTTKTHVIAHILETGAEAWKLDGDDLKQYPACVCVAGNGQDTMVIFEDKTVLLYEAGSGNKLDTLEVPQSLDVQIGFGGNEPKVCGTKMYAVAANSDGTCLTRVDLTKKNVLTKKMPDPAIKDDEDGVRIEALAIVGSPDSDFYAVYTMAHHQDIIFADLTTLDVVKVYGGKTSSSAPSNFKVTADQRYLYYPASSLQGVCVWDVQDARMCTILPEAKQVNDVMTVDMKLLVTITDDRNVCVWDVGQGGQSPAFDFQDHTVTKVENGEKVVVREGKADETEKEDEVEIKVLG